jgi:hypothetical protein
MSNERDQGPLIGDPAAAARRRTGPHAPLPNSGGLGAADVTSGTTTIRASTDAKPDPDDPRERAARRVAELLGHSGEFDLDDDGVNEFYIDPKIIPDGWTYEYRRLTVLGQPDPSYQVSLAMKGWESVPVSRHPELMPFGYEGATIERRGMILMERPEQITERAKARDLAKRISSAARPPAAIRHLLVTIKAVRW